MFEILDSLIATAAVVLGLSLIVQALQQIMKQWLDLKSNYMRSELLSMFNAADIPATAGFMSIKSIAKKNTDEISEYIVSRLEKKIASFGFKDLHLLENADLTKLKQILATIDPPQDATLKSKFDAAMREVDLWFDISKKAFQEHYERRMKYWSLVLSLLITVAMNGNIIGVYRDFSSSKILREAAIKWSEKMISQNQETPPGKHGANGANSNNKDNKKNSLNKAISSDSAATASTHWKNSNEGSPQNESDKNGTPSQPDTTHSDSTSSYKIDNIDQSLTTIRKSVTDNSFNLFRWPDVCKDGPWWELLLGWMVMALLVSLGAPFWYDFLKTVMGVKDKLKK